MRILAAAITITITAMASTTETADAIGRTPAGTLQWLGWGYGAGYHAAIAHPHPPLRRAALHAPGGHMLGPHFWNPTCLAPPAAGPVWPNADSAWQAANGPLTSPALEPLPSTPETPPPLPYPTVPPPGQ